MQTLHTLNQALIILAAKAAILDGANAGMDVAQSALDETQYASTGRMLIQLLRAHNQR